MNFEHVIISALIADVVLYAVMIIKLEVAHHWHMKILDAIHDYIMRKVMNKEYHSWEALEADKRMMYEIEPLQDTVYRLLDWGYKRIVPPETLEKIRPYIK